MKYLIDTNVLISAKNAIYTFQNFPCFWDWLVHSHNAGHIISIDRVKAEIQHERDALTRWAKLHGSFFQKATSARAAAFRAVATWAMDHPQYSSAAKDEFLRNADSELVAHAHAHDCTLVTMEISRTQSIRRIKIPDACASFNVRCINVYQMIASLNPCFRTVPS